MFDVFPCAVFWSDFVSTVRTSCPVVCRNVWIPVVVMKLKGMSSTVVCVVSGESTVCEGSDRER